MGSFAYDRDFLPVANVGDYVYFIGRGYKAEDTYRINALEPIQSYMIDILQISGVLPSGVTALAINGTTNDRTGVIPESTTRNILQVDKSTFAQYRVTLLDDILLQLLSPGAGNPLYSTPNVATTMQAHFAPHYAKKQLTTAPATDTLLWANSSNVDLAAGLAGQTPTRHSRIVGLNIQCSAATTLFFGDAGVTGGTAASSANSVFAVSFVTADWITLGRDSLPQDLYFNSGIVFQQSAAVTTNVTVIVEEDNASTASGQVVERSLANITNNREFFVLEDLCPAIRAINPLTIAQASARVVFAGFQYTLTEQAAPSPNIRKIPIPIASITHLGPESRG